MFKAPLCSVLFLVTLQMGTGWCQQSGDVPAVSTDGIKFSPYPYQNHPNQVFFGDTHLHTSFSADAGLNGGKLGPEDAYRFAKGKLVTSSSGLPARLQRPLDFLVVADHAENLGLPIAIAEKDKGLLAEEWGRKISEIAAPGTMDAMMAAQNFWATQRQTGVDPLASSTELTKRMWDRIIDAAEKHNDPGLFTAFIGFEYTLDPGGNNLHRVVLFKDDRKKTEQILPVSVYLAPDPEDLWDWMELYENKTGGSVLAIPHNGNLSNGLMFPDTGLVSGEPIDAEYAKRRMRWEPLYEITQMKGDGEAHPFLSPDDEFADFETWDGGSFGIEPKTPDMLQREYARTALARGLSYEAKFGVNPFQFGVIGSTDSHTALSTTSEDNNFGKFPAVEPSANEVRFYEAATARLAKNDEQKQFTRETSASGLAAIWARENTREALFDSMKRKEVYATTGTRMRVRVFAGYDFNEEDLAKSNFAAYGYDKGVPMGSYLPTATADDRAGFLVRAIRDPDGANLDRIQMVKGWINAKGEPQERVFNIAWSGDRKLDADGKLAAVGNTVNVVEASYTNAIGEPFLQTYWEDPEFNPEQRAFYYVRVLEIPTPRWTTYDAKVFGVKRPEDVPASIQERAYTSSIWYTPKG